jgi:fibro-slime domain-containing protein
MQVMAAGACGSLLLIPASTNTAVAGDSFPDFIEVTGIVRDFKPCTDPDGHPDFMVKPPPGFGRYSGNIATTLGDNSKPVFTGEGFKVAEEWRDADHRAIAYTVYDPLLGDKEGQVSQDCTGGVESAASFSQWYQDVLGVNLSAPLTLTMARQPDGLYVFDDRLDPKYADLGGFFPIDDKLFGNTPGEKHNFHFTFEMHLDCEYDAEAGQYFHFIGDDDVWIFVNGQLVIDLGGVHAAHDQWIHFDRLGLSDGETYTVDLFFAERYQPQSNFRLETNIPVRQAGTPATTAAYD